MGAFQCSGNFLFCYQMYLLGTFTYLFYGSTGLCTFSIHNLLFLFVCLFLKFFLICLFALHPDHSSILPLLPVSPSSPLPQPFFPIPQKREYYLSIHPSSSSRIRTEHVLFSCSLAGQSHQGETAPVSLTRGPT